jgi:hypothetical protein
MRVRKRIVGEAKMKKPVVVALVLMTLLPVAARADLLPALSPELLNFIATVPESNDFAVGEGKFMKTQKGVSGQVVFSAHGNPLDAHGHIRFDDEEGSFQARATVDCLAVDENRAALSGTFDEVESFPFPGVDPTGFILVVEDNGEPSSKNQNPDRVAPIPVDGPVDPDCGVLLAELEPIFDVLQGNVVVKDRTP